MKKERVGRLFLEQLRENLGLPTKRKNENKQMSWYWEQGEQAGKRKMAKSHLLGRLRLVPLPFCGVEMRIGNIW